MPFEEQDSFYGPLAIPAGLDVSPQEQEFESSVLGAAFRRENPIVSALTGANLDPLAPFDPDFHPWQQLQGTDYEPYADAFSGVANAEEFEAVRLQIDQEIEDTAVLEASGAMGVLAQMGAGLLSPTSLLPGGAVVKGAKGISIGKTALVVGGSAAAAAAIDEAFLHATQQTRTGEESAFAIGGSFILGSFLGAGAGKLTKAEFKAASAQTEQIIHEITEYDSALRSLGAAENTGDLTLRREGALQAINALPILRAGVRSDPVLRTQLSPLQSARQALVRLAETPLQYAVNEQGLDVRNGTLSVEAAISQRERQDLARSIYDLQNAYATYSKDGPVGTLGTITAPITGRMQNLIGNERKLTQSEFFEEVGKAMRSGDRHWLKEVEQAAQALRKNIFDKIANEAVELGLFDEDLTVKNAGSYLTRVYNVEKIEAHLGDGTADDIAVVLRDEFLRRRARAQETLANDRTLFNLESRRDQLKEQRRTAQGAYDKAVQRAKDKRDRAQAAIKREDAVGRATGVLRTAFQRRADELGDLVVSKEERAALTAALKDARALKRLRPTDILQEIRALGGIKDDGSGELQAALDTKLLTIKRNNGLDPDYMREALEELGYLDQGSTVNDLYDAIGRAAGGEDVFSLSEVGPELERYLAAQEFKDAMDELGVDVNLSVDQLIKKLPGKAKAQSITKAKAGEAGRSATKAGKAEQSASVRAEKALDRLEQAQARLDELKDEISPKVREEIKQASDELRQVLPEIKKAQKAQSTEEYYAGLDDVEVDEAVNDAVMSIIQLDPGQHQFNATLSKPTRARVLDVDDQALEPWLENNVQEIIGQYVHQMVPLLEMSRAFDGDVNMSIPIREIAREAARKAGVDPNVVDQAPVGEALTKLLKDLGANTQSRANKKLFDEARERIADLEGMRDRVMRRYGVPANPRSGWVQGTRVARTLSYAGYLGGMTIAAIPDVANVLGRNGIEAAFGAVTAFTDPKRFLTSVKETGEFGAAAEWFLNTRSLTIGEMFDPYGAGTRLERVSANVGRQFSIATGMIPWNVAWKSTGAAFSASKMSKAIDAMRAGKATKKQKLLLGANGIEPWMADRIAVQLDRYADKNGLTWLPRGKNWDDPEAFKAFEHAMNRELDLMVITPGQDKPLSFSSEVGKFFSQFKSFIVSAHHRILLAGIQRSDAEVLAQVTAAIMLGGLVSNIKADLGGYERKEGSAFWVDAIDRSGLAGWLMEPYNALGAMTAGKTMIGGEPVSRFQARSALQGALGPSVDMATGVFEAVNGLSSGNGSYRDIRKLMRPIPGNNLFYLLPLFRQIEDSLVDLTGAKPRPE